MSAVDIMPNYDVSGPHEPVIVDAPVGFAERAMVAFATVAQQTPERMLEPRHAWVVGKAAARAAFLFGLAVLEALAKTGDYDEAEILRYLRASFEANADESNGGDDADREPSAHHDHDGHRQAEVAP